jgi:hypothetical protein
MSELLRRFSRWIDAASLVVLVALFAVSVAARNWFWACIAAIWIFRDVRGLVRPGQRDEDADDTPFDPSFRTIVDQPRGR